MVLLSPSESAHAESGTVPADIDSARHRRLSEKLRPMKKKSVPAILATAITVALFAVSGAQAAIVALNSGSLGAPGNGLHLDNTTGTANDPLLAPGGFAAVYDISFATGSRTEIPFLAALNPIVTSPFTIELWVNPTISSNDSTPLFNRESTGNRSGWIFFQRPNDSGWNFVMYNGNGSLRGWDLTGGSSALNTWHHLVAVWDGSAATLYYNGANTNAVNTPNGDVLYNPNTGPDPDDRLSLGRYGDGTDGTRFTGAVDEMAFYNAALTPAQIAAHFNTATTSIVPGAYSSLVLADGATEYLQNTELVPEPSSVALLAVAACYFTSRRRRPQ
jgi:hypothetical protein